MVMVSNLPSLSTPLVPSTDVAIVSRNNQLFKIDLETLFDENALNLDPSTINHDDLSGVNANQHIDWTNTTENLSTSGTLNAANFSGINTGDQNVFDTFKVLGLLPSTDIIATQPADTFTFVPGPNIDITTDPVTKELFISATGGGGTTPNEITIVKDEFVPDGFNATFALTETPSSEDHVLVFFDAVFQSTLQYSVLGNNLSFVAAPQTYIGFIDAYVFNEPDLVVSRATFQGGLDFAAGVDDTLTLGSTPDSKDAILVFFNGVFQGRDTYNVSGNDITFTNPIPIGTSQVQVVIFTDPGSGGQDIDIYREVYLEGVNYQGGITNLLVMPVVVDNEDDVIVFFDGNYVSNSEYTVNGSVITFANPIPAIHNKVEIINFSGGQPAGSETPSFGLIEVSGQPDLNANIAGDSLEFIAGTDISLTTDAVGNSVTINSTYTPQTIFNSFIADVGTALDPSLSSTVNFIGDANIQVTSNGTDTLTFEFTGAAGEANTVSNQGGFSELFIQKTGIDLEFRTLQSSDSSVIITQNATDIDLTTTGVSRTVTNVGVLPATVGASDYTTNVTVAGTINLPATPSDGELHNIRKGFAGSALTVDGNGNNINGAATVNLTGTNSNLSLQWNAGISEWMIL
jgi:hypothetical protein